MCLFLEAETTGVSEQGRSLLRQALGGAPGHGDARATDPALAVQGTAVKVQAGRTLVLGATPCRAPAVTRSLWVPGSPLHNGVGRRTRAGASGSSEGGRADSTREARSASRTWGLPVFPSPVRYAWAWGLWGTHLRVTCLFSEPRRQQLHYCGTLPGEWAWRCPPWRAGAWAGADAGRGAVFPGSRSRRDRGAIGCRP